MTILNIIIIALAGIVTGIITYGSMTAMEAVVELRQIKRRIETLECIVFDMLEQGAEKL